MKKKLFLNIVIFFGLFLFVLLFAQEKTGRIIGKVCDEDGNPIPGVTVTLFAIAGPTLQAITNADGSFEFLSLSPSKGYAMKCELEGFETITETRIDVVAGQTTEINLEMEMGEIVELILTRHGMLEIPPTKEQIEEIRSAKTIRISVVQSYQDNKDKELKNVHLPLEEIAVKFLKLIGLKVLSAEAKNYDLEIKIETRGFAKIYSGKVAPFSGAQLRGTISFEISDNLIYTETIRASSVIPETTSAPIKARLNPYSVEKVIHGLLNDFEAEIIEDIVRIYGISDVIARLKDENVEIRKYAAKSLRYIENSKAVEPLLSTLKDNDKDVRAAAARSLGHYNNPQVTESLIVALGDKDKEVRAAVVEALIIGRIDSSAVEPLIACLKDEDAIVRGTVVLGIPLLLDDDQQAVEYLLAALTDKSESVRASAAESLVDYFDEPQIVEPLIACLKDKDPGVRAAVARTLGEFYDKPHVIESLIASLNDGDSGVRAAAVSALGHVDDPRGIEPLIIALSDKNERVKAAVLEAFRYSDDPRVVEALIAALKDKDDNFRMYVDEILETITSNSFDGDQKKWQKWWKENKEELIKFFW